MSAPATLVIQQKESLASTDYLRALDELTGIIANTPGVAKSILRPVQRGAYC